MGTVDAYETKNRLPKLLERVMKGECITITKHGVPVAILQPPDLSRTTDTRSVIAEIRRFRGKQSLNGLSLKEIIKEGRR